MALILSNRYPGRFNAPNSAYPQGSFKNRTAPGAKDGSYLEQDWANDKEGFFQALIAAAGLTPNGSVDTANSSQYYTALNTLLANAASGKVSLTAFTGSNQSLTTNGWQKLPGGLIIQWGTTGTINGGSNATVTLPIAFTTAMLNGVTGGRATVNSTTPTYYGWEPISVTQFRIYNQSTQSGFTSWLAWGY